MFHNQERCVKDAFSTRLLWKHQNAKFRILETWKFIHIFQKFLYPQKPCRKMIFWTRFVDKKHGNSFFITKFDVLACVSYHKITSFQRKCWNAMFSASIKAPLSWLFMTWKFIFYDFHAHETLLLGQWRVGWNQKFWGWVCKTAQERKNLLQTAEQLLMGVLWIHWVTLPSN